jgi:rare lipoprotein A
LLSSSGLASADEERFEASSRGTRSERAIGGVATWYGADFQGSPMADGVLYDMWDPTTAASNIYPLGTRLRVTRVETGQSIVVRVTDRGAFRNPILVDLSYAAFSALAHPDVGVIRITVEPID